MRAETCIHYAGCLEDKICRRGIDVRARFQPKWPCWTGNKPPESSGICPFFEAPTAEQISAHKDKSTAAIHRMLAANLAIEQWEATQSNERPLRGTITCPNCGLPMEVLISERRVYAQCETKECSTFSGSREPAQLSPTVGAPIGE